MPDERFDVYFSGQLLAGQDPAITRERVRQLFKATDAQLARLFSGQPVAVKKGVDLDTASRYRLAFRQAGALVDIQASEVSGVPSSSGEVATAGGDGEAPWTLAAAHSGSLESYAVRPPPAPLPDIGGLDLARAGALLDERPPLPEVSIETGDMDLVAGDWSLEDCQPTVTPPPPPDLTGISLEQPGAVLDRSPPPPPAPSPDISGLRLLEPETPNTRQEP